MRTRLAWALAALAALDAATPRAEALALAVNCSSTADCSTGETCVAGDSVTAIQACVSGSGCGGATSGNCPSDAASGQLACIWRESAACSSSSDGCAKLGGSFGIYKCLSIDRCDEYYGSACSEGCEVNGAQCNGKGSCQLSSTASDGTPSFTCACESGWSGSKCTSGSDSDSGSASASTSSSSSSSSSSASSSSSSSSSSSTSSSASTSASSSSSGSSGSVGSEASSGSSTSGEGTLNNSNTAGSTQSNPDGSLSTGSSGGTSSTVFIIIGVLAAAIIVGAVMFAMYSRKKKRAQEAEAGGFGRASTASDMGAAVGGADTPKGNIVTM